VFTGHQDNIRSGAIDDVNPNILITGSHDHTIKLWDTRTGNVIHTLNHGYPVDSLLANKGKIISAGSREVKVWDVLTLKLKHTISQNQKEVVALALDKTRSRLFTGGLDHMVKIYDTATYKCLLSTKFPAPILCLSLSGNSSHLVVGMSNGMLSIQSRTMIYGPQYDAAEMETPAYSSLPNSMKANKVVRPNLYSQIKEEYEHLCYRFRYREALTFLITSGSKEDPDYPIAVISLIEELRRNGAYKQAIAGRNEVVLAPLLEFIGEYITDPRFSDNLIFFLHSILVIYSPVINQSQIIIDLVKEIQQKVELEIVFQKKLFSVIGALDNIIVNNYTNNKLKK